MIQASAQGLPATVPGDPVVIAYGGRLYDDWAKESEAGPQSGDHPLWALQTTNTRTGPDTWRCTECHGWDYKGSGGAYSTGPHKTGFVGVYVAGQTRTKDQLLDLLKGGADYRHDFSDLLTADQLSALVEFLKNGIFNAATYIDYAAATPRGEVDLANGKKRYSRTCAACHGDDGTKLDMGTPDSPKYNGTVAVENPWAFVHKLMYGQPGPEGAMMPVLTTRGWTMQDVMDLLAHSQTMPTQ